MIEALALPTYRRTPAGQVEVLTSKLDLSPAERALLLSVNGYTPLSTLMELRADGAELPAAAQRLLEQGLIEAAPQEDEVWMISSYACVALA